MNLTVEDVFPRCRSLPACTSWPTVEGVAFELYVLLQQSGVDMPPSRPGDVLSWLIDQARMVPDQVAVPVAPDMPQNVTKMAAPKKDRPASSKAVCAGQDADEKQEEGEGMTNLSRRNLNRNVKTTMRKSRLRTIKEDYDLHKFDGSDIDTQEE